MNNNIKELVKGNNTIIKMMAEMVNHIGSYGLKIDPVKKAAMLALLDPESATMEDVLNQQKDIENLICVFSEAAIKYTDGSDAVKKLKRN